MLFVKMSVGYCEKAVRGDEMASRAVDVRLPVDMCLNATRHLPAAILSSPLSDLYHRYDTFG